MITGALARSKELRQAARKAALKDAVITMKSKSGSLDGDIPLEIPVRERQPSLRGGVTSEVGSDTMDAENENVNESGFMATFKTAVQRAYDSVGDPEKEGVQEGDLTNILSKLGYSSEDRETQNILSAAANRADKSSMKFQDIFKLVVGKNEEETISDITNAFEIFDRDDDGKLQTKDLHRALTRIGDDPLTEEEFEEILFLAEIDPDFESFFDYKELTNHKLALSYSTSSNKKAKAKRGGLLSKWNKVPADLTGLSNMLKK